VVDASTDLSAFSHLPFFSFSAIYHQSPYSSTQIAKKLTNHYVPQLVLLALVQGRSIVNQTKNKKKTKPTQNQKTKTLNTQIEKK
jgi:hypothetical protein